MTKRKTIGLGLCIAQLAFAFVEARWLRWNPIIVLAGLACGFGAISYWIADPLPYTKAKREFHGLALWMNRASLAMMAGWIILAIKFAVE